MNNINPQLWYSDRELDYVPPHFTKCNAPITNESLIWIHTRLSGRFVIVVNPRSNMHTFVLENTKIVYFEDSAEAMLYELRWSGHK